MTTAVMPKKSLIRRIPLDIMVMLVMTTLIGSITGVYVWQDWQSKTLLKTSAVGADTLFSDRKNSYSEIAQLSYDIHQTRAPGGYMRGLDIWKKAITPVAIKGQAPWVIELQEKERNEVLRKLAKLGYTPEQVSALHARFSEVTPMLNKEESRIVQELTTFDNLFAIASTRHRTAQAVAEKVHTLGTGTHLLWSLGVNMPQFVTSTLN